MSHPPVSCSQSLSTFCLHCLHPHPSFSWYLRDQFGWKSDQKHHLFSLKLCEVWQAISLRVLCHIRQSLAFQAFLQCQYQAPWTWMAVSIGAVQVLELVWSDFVWKSQPCIPELKCCAFLGSRGLKFIASSHEVYHLQVSLSFRDHLCLCFCLGVLGPAFCAFPYLLSTASLFSQLPRVLSPWIFIWRWRSWGPSCQSVCRWSLGIGCGKLEKPNAHRKSLKQVCFFQVVWWSFLGRNRQNWMSSAHT